MLRGVYFFKLIFYRRSLSWQKNTILVIVLLFLTVCLGGLYWFGKGKLNLLYKKEPAPAPEISQAQPSSKENPALLELREYAKSLPQTEGLIPVEDFLKNSEISGLQISPNGQYLAYLKPYQNRQNIYVRKVDGSEPERRITSQTSRDIAGFGWKENDTLLFVKDFGGDENFHVFRVFATGKGEKDLTPFEGTQVRIIDFLDDISEDSILIGTNQRDKTVFDAYRLNIKTGEIQKIAENPRFFYWLEG